MAPEKIQRQQPFEYLGYVIHNKKIKPQKIQIRTQHLTTLNDFQKLLGDINWLHPSLALTAEQLQLLFQIFF